jgi:hypothetical protein
VDLTQNNHTNSVTITVVSKSREIVLASLTSSELMSSTADLAAHLLHMLQLQSPRLGSTSVALVDNPTFQKDFITQKDHYQSWTVGSMDTQTTMLTA